MSGLKLKRCHDCNKPCDGFRCEKHGAAHNWRTNARRKRLRIGRPIAAWFNHTSESRSRARAGVLARQRALLAKIQRQARMEAAS